MLATPRLHLGAPTHAGPLSVFPVWTDAPSPRAAMRTSLPRGATVHELVGGSEVGRLTIDNPTATPFLLTGGSVFDQGWQHRVLVHGVLVDAGTVFDIDVRCVEQGRWHGKTSQRLHRRRAPLAVRGALRGVQRDGSGDRPRSQEADQGEVWNRVQRYERALGPSASSSLVEVTDRLDEDLPRLLEAVQPLPGQRGALVGIGGHPALLEVFDHHRTLAAQWEAILAGVLVDAHLVPARPTSGRRARTFVGHLSERALRPHAAAGTAIALEARDDLVVADGVATEAGRLLHLSALNVRHELVGAA